MRRVLAIGLAIIIVMIASRGVVAQEDSVSDRLLEILKDRQIISNDEFGELKGLAAEMKNDRADVDRRLGDLDRSIADYLAESGDAAAAGVTYKVGQGFTFTTSDNLFSLSVGGLFQFGYSGTERERDPWGAAGLAGDDGIEDLEPIDRRDVNQFFYQNRFHFTGHAFAEELSYYFEFFATDDVSLYEGYVDYNFCGWTNIRAGQFRMPFGRQNLIHASDLTAGRAWGDFAMNQSVPGIFDDNAHVSGPYVDTGIMLHNMYTDVFGLKGLAAEYMMGAFNGMNSGDNNWVTPAFRTAIYPLGPVANAEGDWEAPRVPKFGFGLSYFYDRGRLARGHEISSGWAVDGVLVWNGLYITGEWQRFRQDDNGTVDAMGNSVSSPTMRQRQWFVQAGFMVMPQELELFIRYAKRGTQRGGLTFGGHDADPAAMPPIAFEPDHFRVNDTVEWVTGAAYYFEGHSLKTVLEIGQMNTEIEGITKAERNVPDDAKIFFIRILFQLEW